MVIFHGHAQLFGRACAHLYRVSPLLGAREAEQDKTAVGCREIFAGTAGSGCASELARLIVPGGMGVGGVRRWPEGACRAKSRGESREGEWERAVRQSVLAAIMCCVVCKVWLWVGVMGGKTGE